MSNLQNELDNIDQALNRQDMRRFRLEQELATAVEKIKTTNKMLNRYRAVLENDGIILDDPWQRECRLAVAGILSR